MLIGRRPVRAATAYYWFEGSWSLLHALAFTLALLYQVQVAGLTPFQLILVGTVMEATCFLFEIPTGIVADLYSRRLSALIGAFVVGIGILIQGIWPSFGPIVLATVVWGIGYTFVSGAVDAWITDEVGENAMQPLFTRYQQQHLALTVVGTILAGVVGQVNLQLPMIVAGAGFLVLGVVMTVVMPENGFHPVPRPERDTWSHLRRTLLTGVAAARRPGVVRSFLVIAVLTGVSSEVFDRLWTARVLEAFRLPTVLGVDDPAIWFTAFALIGSLLALLASVLANRLATERLNALHPAGLLATLLLVQVAGMVGFALSGSLWPALVALWVRDSARAIAYPVQGAWINRNVESRTRATTLSLTSQADAIGQVVGGPPLGALATRTSIPVALLVSAGVLAPAALVYARLRPSPDETD
ncbi:MFS transporter [Humibacillus sp. DSM 29435]|uniref:MFS transporter n=1 Tax=Humibacillus sp. DSM 29435 TaxID=1869167 RepID=UPI0009F27EB1|nr:MFS transporter [Humibacillus sp. DSM 29435]